MLPLKNLSAEATEDYFSDGIVEDIIVSLSGLRELLVIARLDGDLSQTGS